MDTKTINEILEESYSKSHLAYKKLDEHLKQIGIETLETVLKIDPSFIQRNGLAYKIIVEDGETILFIFDPITHLGKPVSFHKFKKDIKSKKWIKVDKTSYHDDSVISMLDL